MPDTIKPIRTENYRDFHDTGVKLGLQVIETPKGKVLFNDAPAISIAAACTGNRAESKVLVLLSDPAPMGDTGMGFGMISQLSAEHARNVGQSLLRMADLIERSVQ